MKRSYRQNLKTILGAIQGRGIKTAEKMIEKELEELQEDCPVCHGGQGRRNK